MSRDIWRPKKRKVLGVAAVPTSASEGSFGGQASRLAHKYRWQVVE